MKILAALLGVLVAVPAFATDPQFGAIRIEATQNVIHAFVSGMPQGGDATKVSKDEWNAAHTVPAILIASVPTGIVWPIQPAALTEFCGVTTYRWRANLANTSTIRLTTQVIAAGAATSALRLQYTTDTTGASGWAYLDSASGPSVAVDAIAIAVSSSVSVATAAKADVLLRLVGINGDGAGGQACHSSILASNATSATSAATAIALAANGTNCSAGQFPLGVDASGAVETCTALPTTITGTANQITASAATGGITLSIPTSPTLPGTTTGTFSGNVTGNVSGSSGSTTGNAATATALAANGTNCSAGQFPLGVNASGAVETCTALPTTITGTANQIAASGSTGAITLSIPSSPTLPGTTTGTFSGNVTGNVTGSSGSTTGNAGTATALAANGANCSADQFPLGVDASGVVETCTALPTTITGTANQIAASGSTGAITLSIPSPTLQLGVDVNGSPVAQTLKAHNGITGTDIAGASLSLASGIGTGAGASPAVIIKTPTIGASSTTPQSLASTLTISNTAITPLVSIRGVRNTTAGTPAYGFVTGDLSAGLYYTSSQGIVSLCTDAATYCIGMNWSGEGLVGTTNLKIGWGTNASGLITTGPNAFFMKDAAAAIQLGVDVNGSPVAQTLKAHDGITGTDIAASSLTLGSQIGTGTGVNQNNINRALTKATGTTAQTTANAFTVCASKILSNTSATATTFATIALASNSGGGASVELSLTATDGTNFDSETQSANLAFVNKATVMTVSTPTVTASSSANNSGSATIGFTATGTSPTISLKVTPVFTTIVPTTVTLYAIVKSHGAGAVTCQ